MSVIRVKTGLCHVDICEGGSTFIGSGTGKEIFVSASEIDGLIAALTEAKRQFDARTEAK